MLAKDIREVRAVPVQAQQQDRQNFVEQAKERARAQVSQMREAQAAQLAAAKAQLAEQQAAQARAEQAKQQEQAREAAKLEASRPKPAPDRGQGYGR
jgi:hypothetical protein